MSKSDTKGEFHFGNTLINRHSGEKDIVIPRAAAGMSRAKTHEICGAGDLLLSGSHKKQVPGAAKTTCMNPTALLLLREE